ncbi:MAG: type VI secretion system tip protein VgrG [Deltaproteobacteria bacterium]|nr:type VI secretion system tip protein VgrG [Deltaproteobacteria bacterium]
MAPTLTAHESRFLFEVLGVSYQTAVLGFKLFEGISSPFALHVSLVSEDEINFDEVVGKEALLTLLGEENDRYLHGILRQFIQNGSKGRFYFYEAEVVPSLWLLSLEQDCRIFQNMKVEDIIKKVLQDGGITGDRFNFRLQGNYPEREYCVQYRETDFDFVSRLCEEEGIFYFFEHARDKHVLVFGDSTVAYQTIEGEEEITFNPAIGMVPGQEFVYHLAFSQKVFSGKMTRRDFNFEKPTLDLTSKEQDKSYQKLEVYDYPGRYVEENRGKGLTKVRLEESITFKEKAEGKSNSPRLTPGFKFKLIDHERQSFNQEYLLAEIRHEGQQPQALQELADPKEKFSYTNGFISIPSSVVFRPERKTPKPVVKGIQTAVVVGPSGEEIYTDKYGRIKVQFHWDREGQKDDKSSCWIRVASILAGGQYGAIFTPRIGQEVIVDFLEGDPDQPLITGRVYNADLMPPYTLPDEKTKSTIKTNSSTGGEGFNEIRFEDKKGEEQVFVHAEKDLDIRVKNDRRELVGNDRHLIVKRDLKEKIEFDKHVIVEKSEFREVKTDYNLKVGGKKAVEVAGSSSLKVTGNVVESFNANHSENVTGTLHLKGMNVKIEGMTGMELKVGGSSIILTPAAIFIQGGPLVNINSGSGPPVAPASAALVPPAAPVKPDMAASATPGKDVKDQEQRHKESTEEEEEEKKSWIEIELVDEDDNPVSGEKYKVTLPDGKTVAEGTLDENGFARVDGIDPGNCKITFPSLDKDAWEKA